MRNVFSGLALGLLVAGAAVGAAPPEIRVSVAPALQAELDKRYGSEEAAVLGGFVTDSMRRALKRPGAPEGTGLTVEVVLESARPSHPTRAQTFADPALDPMRSRSLGGATLSGTVRDSDGRVLTSLSYEHYPVDFTTASAGGDPWADARIAIDGFTAALVKRMRAPR